MSMFNSTNFGFKGFPSSNEILRDALSRTTGGRGELYSNFLAGNKQFQGFNPRARQMIGSELFDPLQAAFVKHAAHDWTPEDLDFRGFLASGGQGRLNAKKLNSFKGLFSGVPGSPTKRAQRDLLEENADLLIGQAAAYGLNPLLRPYATEAAQRSVGAFRDQNLVDPVFAQYYNGRLF